MQLGSIILAACVAVSGPNAQIEGTPSGSRTQREFVVDGTVAAKYDIELAAAEAGVLDEMFVEVGETVKKKQPLAKVDDNDIQIRLEVAKLEETVARMEADDDSNVRSAMFTAGVAKAEWEDSLRINERSPGSIPPTQLRREELTWKRTSAQADVAKLEQSGKKKGAEIKAKQVAAAQLAVARRTVTSRYDGVIEERYKDVGEWVSPGDRIFRLVHMDTLKVVGFLNYHRFPPRSVQGLEVDVRVGKTILPGKVTAISRQNDSRDQYGFTVEVKNKQNGLFYVLRPGMKVEIVLKSRTR